MADRFKKLAAGTGIVLFIGCIYAVLYTYMGIVIPCLFHEITGLYCPGCGISRMCLALMRLDFAAAFWYNPAVMLALPVFAILAIQMSLSYIKTGEGRPTKNQSLTVWLLIVYFLIFGLVRNLPQFAFLTPGNI